MSVILFEDDEDLFYLWYKSKWKFIIPFNIFKTLKLSEIIKYKILDLDLSIIPKNQIPFRL